MALVRRPTEGKGDGVFTTAPVGRGEKLMDFTGPIVTWDAFVDKKHDIRRFVQVGENAFMGSSGGLDDLINHSCRPNCALLVDPPRLVALRDIEAGEEVTFDYSVTSLETPEDWQMECHCGSFGCRGLISGFPTVPLATRIRYLFLGIVPDYVRCRNRA